MLRAVGAHAVAAGTLSEDLLRAATTMSGGLAGRRDGPCGAMLGGLMLIGTLFGRAQVGEDDKTAPALGASWRARFRREFGEEHCAALRAGQTVKAEYQTLCGPLIVQAACMLAEQLNELA